MQMDPLASGGDPETAGGAADGAFVIVAGDVVGDGNEGQFAVLVGARVSVFGGQSSRGALEVVVDRKGTKSSLDLW